MAGLLLTAWHTACSNSPAGPTPPPPPPPPSGNAVLLMAGDIGMCGSPGTEATAQLIDRLEGTVVLAGDIAYMHGSTQDFSRCFHPFWGRFSSRWFATPGNHEYETGGASAYFDYFGEAAGDNRDGYFAFLAGGWQVLMLNSNISTASTSPQGIFVRQQLDRHVRCTIAVWHHPLYSSGPNGPHSQVRELWATLQAAGVEIVVNAHDHLYERFGRQNADGRLDVDGVRQFIVGTGGADLYRFGAITPNSEVRLSKYGVLRLTLQPAGYRWEFLTTPGGLVEDSGSDSCR